MNADAKMALQLREGKSKPELSQLFEMARGQDPIWLMLLSQPLPAQAASGRLRC